MYGNINDKWKYRTVIAIISLSITVWFLEWIAQTIKDMITMRSHATFCENDELTTDCCCCCWQWSLLCPVYLEMVLQLTSLMQVLRQLRGFPASGLTSYNQELVFLYSVYESVSVLINRKVFGLRVSCPVRLFRLRHAVAMIRQLWCVHLLKLQMTFLVLMVESFAAAEGGKK